MSQATRQALLAAAAAVRARPVPPPRPVRPGPERPRPPAGPGRSEAVDPTLLEQAATELAVLESALAAALAERDAVSQHADTARHQLLRMAEDIFEARTQRHAAWLHAQAAALDRREQAVALRESARPPGPGDPGPTVVTPGVVAEARRVEQDRVAAERARLRAAVEDGPAAG